MVIKWPYTGYRKHSSRPEEEAVQSDRYPVSILEEGCGYGKVMYIHFVCFSVILMSNISSGSPFLGLHSLKADMGDTRESAAITLERKS